MSLHLEETLKPLNSQQCTAISLIFFLTTHLNVERMVQNSNSTCCQDVHQLLQQNNEI